MFIWYNNTFLVSKNYKFRSSRSQMVYKICALKYLAKITGKHLYPACNFNKRKNPAQMFSCDFYEIFNNIFLQNTSRQQLLQINLTAYHMMKLCSFTIEKF